MPPDPHGPPGDLDTTAKALYRKLRDFLKAQHTWENSDKYALGQTCRYEQRARLARTALEKSDEGMTTQGRSEHSGSVAHPLVRIMEVAEAKFMDGLRELGLTPAARKRLEIEVKRNTGGGKFDS